MNEELESDPFADFLERGLSYDGSGGSAAIEAKENIAWELHESGSAAGGMLLGDTLLSSRVSYCRSDIKVVPFSKALVEESFKALEVITDKNSWDWYFLGVGHQYGRGTDVDQEKAASCYQRAAELGNPYAEFEEIWSRYLATQRAFEAIARFRSCQGRLSKFARISADSLSLLALGPVKEMGSYAHAWRVLELSKLLHVFIYHDQGGRQINIAVEKELRADVDGLEAMQSPSAAFVLYLISKSSRKNPTSNEPDYWLRKAATPDDVEFLDLLKQQESDCDELDMLIGLCEEKGWTDSELGQYLTIELAQLDEWEE